MQKGKSDKERISNVWSLIINLSIVYFTISAIAYTFRSDIIVVDPWYGFVGFDSLKFFTSLSNILVALASFVMLIFNIKNLSKGTNYYPAWATTFKYLATVGVAVTFFTVAFFLAPAGPISGKSFLSFYTANSFFLHFLTPVLAIISFVLFEKMDNFKFSETLWGLLPVVLYAIVYVIMVVIVGSEGGWPDFYGFTFGGSVWAAICSCVVMISLTWGLSVLIRFVHIKWTLQKEKLPEEQPVKTKNEEQISKKESDGTKAKDYWLC